MAEITVDGVTGKTLSQYRDEITADYLDIDPNWNVLPESPDGQIIAIWAETLANLDEQVQFAYMARDPATATGQALSDIAAYAGLERKSATFSTAEVTLGGTTGTFVPAGSRVRNSQTGTLWSLNSGVTIDGPTTGFVTATESGSLSAGIGTLTEIADPVAGWQTVTNDEAAVQGLDVESDDDLRFRRNQSVALPGSNQIDNIASSVLNVDGVQQARIYENQTDSASVSALNPHGLAPHSIAIFAQGGADGDVTDAIAVKKNPGCGMNFGEGIPNEITAGTTTPLGNPVSITFFRPELVTIHVAVEINTTELPEAEKDNIKQAIVDFSLQGLTGQGDGFTRRGFQIGERVAAGRLYTPVNNIVADQGFVESILVGDVDPPVGTSVSIDFNQLATFDVSTITVTYV